MHTPRASLLLAVALFAACSAPSSAGPASPDPSNPDPSGPEASLPTPSKDAGARPDLGNPIEIPADQLGQWVWISMPTMYCADGSTGGFAVNFTNASRHLVVYLQGGGICYDALTCAVTGAALSVGADPIKTALDPSIRGYQGIFNRSDGTNPFRDDNFVVVPHCTGDHHTGNRVATYGGKTYHHVGYTNITRLLERVVPTFADADRVVLAGFSAGGVGITANYHQLATAFESVGQPSPYLIIDSGPFMRPSFLKPSAQAMLRQNWGLDGTIGTFCPSCLSDGFHALYEVNAKLHPGLRSSLIVANGDLVVEGLYSLLNQGIFGPTQMQQGLDDLRGWTESIAASVQPSVHRVFYYNSTRHGALNVAALSATPGLADFLSAQLGSGAWESVP